MAGDWVSAISDEPIETSTALRLPLAAMIDRTKLKREIVARREGRKARVAYSRLLLLTAQ